MNTSNITPNQLGNIRSSSHDLLERSSRLDNDFSDTDSCCEVEAYQPRIVNINAFSKVGKHFAMTNIPGVDSTVDVVIPGYAGFLLQEYGTLNWDLRGYLIRNYMFINQLNCAGYSLFIENGPMVGVISYTYKKDITHTIDQHVYSNRYFMQRGKDTFLILCDGLTYRCDLTIPEIHQQYDIKSIVDFELRRTPKYGFEGSPIEYLIAHYYSTESEFVKHLESCREFLSPILTDAYSQGYRVKAFLKKDSEMRMFRLREQYRIFAQDERRLSVVLNKKLLALPTQLIATTCTKSYGLIQSNGTSDGKVLFSCKGVASAYDAYLKRYYIPMG